MSCPKPDPTDHAIRPIDSLQWVRFTGVHEVIHAADGLLPQRFSSAQLDTFARAGSLMTTIARMSTGVELQVRGTCLGAVAFVVRVLDHDGYGLACECYLDDLKLLPHWRLDGGTGIQRQVFNVPDDKVHTVRLLLPTHATVMLVAVQTGAGAILEEVPADSRPLWVVHGDSITQGANVSVPSLAWPALTAAALGLRHANLGIGGHARFELEVAEALATRSDAALISLHCGTNWKAPREGNAAALFRRVGEYLAIIRRGLPVTPLTVATPIARPHGHDEAETLEAHLACNRAIADAVRARQVAGDRSLHLIDGAGLATPWRGYLADRVHLDDHGNAAYAAALAPHLFHLLPKR